LAERSRSSFHVFLPFFLPFLACFDFVVPIDTRPFIIVTYFRRKFFAKNEKSPQRQIRRGAG
jgi:hypothetical protein